MSNDGGYAALRHGTGALEVGRDVVRVSGPDAQSYLQGQTSQDVAGLGAGASAWALVLQPQGKLDVFVRVFRLGPDEFLLDSDAGMGARSPGPADPFQATYQGGYRASGVAGRRGSGTGGGTGTGLKRRWPECRGSFRVEWLERLRPAWATSRATSRGHGG